MDKYEKVIERLYNFRDLMDKYVRDYKNCLVQHDSDGMDRSITSFNRIDHLFYQIECIIREYDSRV